MSADNSPDYRQQQENEEEEWHEKNMRILKEFEQLHEIMKPRKESQSVGKE